MKKIYCFLFLTYACSVSKQKLNYPINDNSLAIRYFKTDTLHKYPFSVVAQTPNGVLCLNVDSLTYEEYSLHVNSYFIVETYYQSIKKNEEWYLFPCENPILIKEKMVFYKNNKIINEFEFISGKNKYILSTDEPITTPLSTIYSITFFKGSVGWVWDIYGGNGNIYEFFAIFSKTGDCLMIYDSVEKINKEYKKKYKNMGDKTDVMYMYGIVPDSVHSFVSLYGIDSLVNMTSPNLNSPEEPVIIRSVFRKLTSPNCD